MAQKNLPISKIIEDCLRVKFNNSELKLGQWGFADNWSEFNSSTKIILECEWSQRHPCTNVLKQYPYLEENQNIRVCLIQFIANSNEAPQNRKKLCEFIGRKIELEFPDRFLYVLIQTSCEEFESKLQGELEAKVLPFLRQL